MSYSMRTTASRAAAGAMAAIFALSAFPFDAAVISASAESLASYTIKFTNGEGEVQDVDGVKVTLTSVSDPSMTEEKYSADGEAVFENFAESGADYTVSFDFTGVYGFKALEDNTLTADSDSWSAVVEAIPKYTVSGKIVLNDIDKLDTSVSPSLSYWGYGFGGMDDPTAVSVGADGGYSYEVYGGYDYSVSVSAGDEYTFVTDVKNVSADTENADYTLDLQTYSLKRSVMGTGGGISFELMDADDKYQPIDEESITDDTIYVNAASKVKAVVKPADESFVIKSLEIGGESISQAVNKSEYDAELSGITKNTEIKAEFQKKTYTVIYTVGANGELYKQETDSEGNPSGWVKVVKDSSAEHGSSITLKAEPIGNFHVSSFKTDNVERITDADKAEKNTPKEFTYTISDIKKDISVEVVFEIDKFDVAVTNGEGGSVNCADTITVDHGCGYTIEITPQSGKHIDSITKKYTEIVHDEETGEDRQEQREEPLEFAEKEGSGNTYLLDLISVTYDFEVVITYADDESAEVPGIPGSVTSNLSELVANGRYDEGSNTYYIPGGSTVTFSYNAPTDEGKKYGIAVNKSGNANRNNRSVSITSGTEIKTISLYFDKQWHDYELAKPINIVFDGTAPTIGNISKVPASAWTNDESVIISVKPEDNEGGSGVKTVTIAGKDETPVDMTYDSESGTYTYTVSEEQDKTYTITVTDYTGNVDSEDIAVGIDRHMPDVTGSELTVSDGLFVTPDDVLATTNDVKLTVSAADAETDLGGNPVPSSGIADIRLYAKLIGGTDGDIEIAGTDGAFTVSPDEFSGKTFNYINFYAVAVDNAGNESDKTSLKFKFNGNSYEKFIISSAAALELNLKEKSEPIYTSIDENTNIEKKWYDGNAVGFDLSCKDSVFGINDISIDINGNVVSNDNVDGLIAGAEGTEWKTALEAIKAAGEYSQGSDESSYKRERQISISAEALSESGYLDDGENTIKLTAKNPCGGEKSSSYTFYIDKTAPEITDISFNDESSTVEKAINFLSFGYFFKEKVTVKVSVKDDNASSGLKSAEMTYTKKSGEKETLTADIKDGKAEFDLPEEAVEAEKIYVDGILSFTACDNVSNVSDVSKPKNGDGRVMIENIPPRIEEMNVPDPYADINESTADGNKWYNKDIDVDITVIDAESGLNKAEFYLNDDSKPFRTKDYSKEKTAKVSGQNFTVNTSIDGKDGKYTFKTKVTDNAGNENEDQITIYKDTVMPEITDFEFLTPGYSDSADEAPKPVSVVETKYGYYFREDTTVRIHAVDNGGENASGVNYIYYLLDNAVSDDTPSGANVKAVKEGDKGGYIDITVKAGFKGRIYACATDNAGNNYLNYVTPDGTIIETQDQHEQEGSHISISRPAPVSTTNSGNPLYAGTVPVTITVTDRNSGIRSVSCSINGKDYSTEIPNNIGQSEYGGWRVAESEDNLVYKLEKTIEVSDNINDIPVIVDMTDRSGNTSRSEDSFSIDTTEPKIELKWDNTQPDPENKSYYNKNRTATITVTDRNFSGSDLVLNITSTENVTPSAGSWTSSGSGDSMKHTTTVTFSADGDYTFSAYCYDRAGNRSNDEKTPEFTVDKTVPVISVEYSGLESEGSYFAGERTAKITVTEHNFQESRVTITGTAENDGAKVKFPENSKWKQSGDKYTTEIKYSDEALYSFAISVKDKAGNESSKFEKQSFTIDKTPPEIVFSGVKDKSANNGEVAPVITMTDTNYDESTVKITLNGANNGKSDYPGSFSETKSGQIYTFENFEKKKEIDDIYTLSVSVTDLAGNTASGAITFSANRFGSVYTIDDSTKEILGKYVNKERNIVVTETNVDELVEDSINVKVVKNGSPTDLKKDSGYTLNHEGGDGEWSVYTYTVKASEFENDGSYGVSIFSNDMADNDNDTAAEQSNAEISFGIDKTAPIIVPVNLKSEETYKDEVKNVKIEISDNLVLDTAEVKLNGKKVECEIEGNTFNLKVPESAKRQNISVTATDSAGNEAQLKITDFLVSSNAFVRWYNNTPLFIGTIIGIVAAIAALIFFIIFFRKKKLSE